MPRPTKKGGRSKTEKETAPLETLVEPSVAAGVQTAVATEISDEEGERIARGMKPRRAPAGAPPDDNGESTPAGTPSQLAERKEPENAPAPKAQRPGAPRLEPGPGATVNISKLQAMSISDLNVMAKEMGIENFGTMKKH